MKYHFTPAKGWMNDPNGLIFVNDEYHLFYQHYPNDTVWGPMHWGHAVSNDLLNWKHLPIALFPDENEYCFSGSAIIDDKNVSRLGDEKPAMLLFYTAFNPANGEQKQHIAYSTDYVNFKKYKNNPVIDNSVEIKKDFRDPKVIPNQILGGYTMILAAGDKIEFYHSNNLLNWEYTGNFIPQDFKENYICECPDLLCFDGKYVLTMSLVFPGEVEDHLMPYFVGEFDGKRFINSQNWEVNQLLDHGKENYAMVSFAGTDEKIMLGWGEDWNYARKNENVDYFGKMTLPRKVSLVKKSGKYLLQQKPVVEKSAVFYQDGNYMICKDEDFYEFFLENGTISFSVDKSYDKTLEGLSSEKL